MDTFYVKYCSVTYAVLQHPIGITFLSKKNKFLDFFLCNYMLSKTSDNDISRKKP